jgi:nickel superoxide dismutase
MKSSGPAVSPSRKHAPKRPSIIFEEFPQLHQLFWDAIHQAGEAKKTMDPAAGEKLVEFIDQIAVVFWSTEKSKAMGVYPPA